MRRPIWSLGVLVGLAGAAHAAPTIDCTGLGELVGAEAGYVSIEDEVFEISVRAVRQGVPLPESFERPEAPGLLHPEDFCADRGGMIAFILPVPKVNPGSPDVDPDMPEPTPEVGPKPDGPPEGFGTEPTTYEMAPGKSSQGSEAAEASAAEEAPDEPIEWETGPAASGDDEPAPSPSRAPEAHVSVGVSGAGCATSPGRGPAGLGWLLAALVLLRRKGGAR